MTSGFKIPNISRNTRWSCNLSLLFKNLPLKLHVIQTPLQNLGRNSLYLVLNISYFSHFTSNMSGQQCMRLEATLAWKTCTFSLTKKLCLDSFIKKTTTTIIELCCDLWKLFYSKWTEIIVEMQLIWCWLANVLCLLSDYKKRRNDTVNEPYQWFWRKRLLNSLYTRPNSPFNVIVYNVWIERVYLILEIRGK